MRVQGRATVVLNPGDGFLIPPRTPHNARDLGPETGGRCRLYRRDRPADRYVRGPTRSAIGRIPRGIGFHLHTIAGDRPWRK